MATEAVLETLRHVWLALGFEFRVLACEDLIPFKLLAGRIIDRADAAALLRANSARLDQGLLLQLAARLELTAALSEIRREAFE